jgi:hypothetical protein
MCSMSEPVSEDARVCPHCAETVKREAVVCRYCGRNLGEKPGTPSHNRRTAFIVGAVAIALVAAGTLVLLSRGEQDQAVDTRTAVAQVNSKLRCSRFEARYDRSSLNDVATCALAAAEAEGGLAPNGLPREEGFLSLGIDRGCLIAEDLTDVGEEEAFARCLLDNGLRG